MDTPYGALVRGLPTWGEGDSYRAQVDLRERAARLADEADREIARLREALETLWHLALEQPEFTNFCDEVVVTARAALKPERPPADG